LGYAFGDRFATSTDGGARWTTQDAPNVASLETDGRDVIRLSYNHSGCPGPCEWSIEQTSVGSNTWHKLSIPALRSQAVSAQLVRQGHDNVYAAFFGHTAGGAGSAQTDLLVSRDDGRHWTLPADPCASASGGEIDSIAFAAAAGGAVAALCQPRTEERSATVVVSTDSAVTFGAQHPVVSRTGPGTIAMGSPGDIVVATPPTGGSGQFGFEADVSHDGGRTWMTAVTDVEDIGETGGGAFLGFQSTRVGRWVGYPRTIWTTTDGGDHWTAHHFS
jgi:hypothetical protein